MNKNFSFRVKFVSSIILISFFLIFTRLFYLQVILNPELTHRAEKESKRKITEIDGRGKIYDINGEILADSIVSWDIAIMKKEFDGKFTNKIAEILNKNPQVIANTIKKAKNYVKIAKKADRIIYDKLKEFITNNKVKGVILEPVQERIYPSEVAKEIIGLTNQDKGLTQIELIYDKYLKAPLITRETLRDASGNIIYEGKETITEKPKEIYLTINSKIQFAVEEILKQYVKNSIAESGVAIVQEPNSGKIVAMASYPQNYVNLKPVEWTYEPGSTFKTIILAAGFEENIISEEDYFFCENGSWKFNSKVTIRDHEPEGNLKLNEVFEKSSNIGFAKIGLKIGLEKVYFYIKAFGFGMKTGIGFPGESAGLMRNIKDYTTLNLAVTSYGHSISVTPLQLINAYSAIANGGKLLQPYIVDRIIDPENQKLVLKNEPKEIRKILSDKTIQRVKNMLIGVVDRGTGKNAQIIGYSVAGKTGTSNKIDPRTKKYLEKQNITSFCGFFPASNPKYTILVIIDNPKKFHYGGEVAAPAFAEIAKRIINIENIKPDRPVNYKDVLKVNYKQTISD